MAEAPKWLQTMRALIGTVEEPGAADNPKILAMRDEIARIFPDMASYCANYTHDSIPWCGLASAYCMAKTGIRPPFGTGDLKKFLWARSWDGDPGFPEISSPRLGCVVVLEREGGGHVAFYERTEGSNYVCCGGNQSDAINLSKFPISNVVGLAWPGDPGPVPPPTERRELKEGDSGLDVMALQKTLGIPADGEFGPVTETQVMAFQAACGIDVDGEVGPQTWTEIDKLVARLRDGGVMLQKVLADKIVEIAKDSALFDYSWPGRGKPPVGYIPGMALAFAEAVVEFLMGSDAMNLASRAATGDADKDALTWLAPEFAAAGMTNTSNGLDTLRHLFVLLIGLGMRESSGKYCEGRDLSASNVSADTCEAGLFQTSWNISASHDEFDDLIEFYWSDPHGFLETFAEGVSPTANNLQVFGTGQGARYQFLAKYCPLFAAMTTAVGLRTLRKHWGPVNRKEVTLRPEADVLLLAVQHAVLAYKPPSSPAEPVEPPLEEGEVVITVRSKGKVKVTVVQQEN